MQGAMGFVNPLNYKFTEESSSEKLLKSVKIWRNYGPESLAPLFFAHSVESHRSQTEERAVFRVTVDGRVVCCVHGECMMSTVEPRRVDRRKCGQQSSTVDEFYWRTHACCVLCLLYFILLLPCFGEKKIYRCAKKLYIIQHTMSLEPFKIKWNGFHQNVPTVSGNKDYVVVFM